MFERFADAARQSVIIAQEEARERRSRSIRAEHVLLAVSRLPHTPGAALLAARGVTTATIEADLRAGQPDDREALAALGIDLDEVRSRAERTFGTGALDGTAAGRRKHRRRTGHLPFSGDAKKVLELALREAKRAPQRPRTIGTEHVLLGLLHPESARAHSLLTARGLTLEQLRREVDEPGPGAATG